MKRKQTKKSEPVTGINYSGSSQAVLHPADWESRRRLELLKNRDRNIWRNEGYSC